MPADVLNDHVADQVSFVVLSPAVCTLCDFIMLRLSDMIYNNVDVSVIALVMLQSFSPLKK